MRLGIDYGGTKIEGIVLDAEGTERARKRVATPRGDYDAGLKTIRQLMLDLESESGTAISRVGIGVPGSVDRDTGEVSLGNATWLHGRPLRSDLASCLDRPVEVANDANCFALSEAIDGAGQGHPVVFGVILGTGVGGGIVVDGRVLPGANAIAGEWGHIPLPDPEDAERPGPRCSCGRFGHVEAWLSGPNLSADHARTNGIDPSLAPDAAEIVARAEAGDQQAEGTMTRYEQRLGRALAAVINVLDPDAIVIGGGLSNVARLYRSLPDAIKPHVFGDRFRTRIVPNRHGDSSGVRGAAWL